MSSCTAPISSAFASFALWMLTIPSTSGEVVQAISVNRTYDGDAKVTNGGGTTSTEPLQASESGLGSLGPVTASSNVNTATATAKGIESTATIDNPDPGRSVLTLATETEATHRINGVAVYTPSRGNATSAIEFLGALDTSSPFLRFDSTYTSTGNGNSGNLRVIRNGSEELFNASLDSLPSTWQLAVDGASQMTLEVNLSTSSLRGPGTFTNTTYRDSDLQSLSLGVTAVPEPRFAGMLAATIFVAGYVVRCRHRRRSRFALPASPHPSMCRD